MTSSLPSTTCWAWITASAPPMRSTTWATAASAASVELLQNQFRIGLSRMERVIRERMTLQNQENGEITPQSLVNIRPVVAAIKEFIGSSPLSQFMDQNNPWPS